MSSRMSWGKAYILIEALLLLALSFVYSLYLMVTEEMLGVIFLVLAFMSITAIYTYHYIMHEKRARRRRLERKRIRARKKAKEGKAAGSGGEKGAGKAAGKKKMKPAAADGD